MGGGVGLSVGRVVGLSVGGSVGPGDGGGVGLCVILCWLVDEINLQLGLAF